MGAIWELNQYCQQQETILKTGGKDMRIHIEGDLFVSGDRLGYTIERKQVIKEGKTAGTESYVAIGHYSQLKNAIKDLTKMKVADSTASTLNELLQEINRYHGEIEAKVLI